jgi:hypothetical protein
MKPLQHIYQIRPEDVISELSPTDVRIGKLEIEVERLNELIIKQTDINKNIIEILQSLSNETKVSE